MTTFQALLNVHTKDISSVISIMGQGEEGKRQRPPLCKMKATMNGKDIIATTSLSDMYKYLSKSVKHIAERAMAFIRWMYGTCRETAPLVVNEDEEPVTFTFYSDISQNPFVNKMTLSLNQEIHKVFNIVNRYFDSWRRYDTCTTSGTLNGVVRWKSWQTRSLRVCISILAWLRTLVSQNPCATSPYQ